MEGEVDEPVMLAARGGAEPALDSSSGADGYPISRLPTAGGRWRNSSFMRRTEAIRAPRELPACEAHSRGPEQTAAGPC